ncbi:carbon monoxide dehydrogenase [Solihabitans fulvus]|uniref:Carbon monoxide dehydrogenase n=1 Tax=Solihabitans fulvus TaxID=1892852 RepID=A0A5B2WAM4_9PSEU|nr:SRPBCC family protein [Solihabitans fulvus]KAA2248881.1 carbon monoxide dehydrogenase [Solihabitans fulvus]
MQLEHRFSVPAPVSVVWAALLDPARVAPCLPGASLASVEGQRFTGTVRVKVGPISLTYKGYGEFVETDEGARTLVIEASGRDVRGNGTAAAKVAVTLTSAPDDPAPADHPSADSPSADSPGDPSGDSPSGASDRPSAGASDGASDGVDRARMRTNAEVRTDLSVTGRPAQFGRGLIGEVGGRILESFAANLADVLSGAAADEPAAAPSARPELRVVSPRQPDAEPLDLLRTAGSPVLRRVGPVLVALLVLVVLWRRRRRRF